MKLNNAINIVTLFFVGLMIILPAQPVAANRQGAFLYERFTPPVIFNDGQDSTTLEIFTTGENIANVNLRPDGGNSWFPMYNDGTHGDKQANDAIYTLDQITTSFAPVKFELWIYNVMGWTSLEAQITYTNDQEPDIIYLSPMVVDSRVSFPSAQIGEGLYATEYALFISDQQGDIFHSEPYPAVDQEIDFSVATRKFYSIYPDEFDFLVVIPTHRNYRSSYGYLEGPVPFEITVRTPAKGIGEQDFNDAVLYGSQGRLLSVVYHSAGYGSVLTHEIGHTWSAYVGFDSGLLHPDRPFHWTENTDIGGIMSEYIVPPNNQNVSEYSTGTYYLQANVDGTFQMYDAQSDKANDVYAPLELYLMGLVPPEEVPPVNVLINPDYSNPEMVTAEQINTYTIQDIIAQSDSARIPAYPEAQKAFNIGFIFFSDQEFSPAELAWGSMVARGFSAQESVGVNNFYTATGGRATLNAHLPDWGIPANLPPYSVPQTGQENVTQPTQPPDPAVEAQKTPTQQMPNNIPCLPGLILPVLLFLFITLATRLIAL